MSKRNNRVEIIDLCSSEDEKNADPPARKRQRLKNDEIKDRATQRNTTSEKEQRRDKRKTTVLGIEDNWSDSGIVVTCRMDELLLKLGAFNANDGPTRPNLQLTHIQQGDKWSCGYRNMQMVMMALIPNLPPDHSFFSRVNPSTSFDGSTIQIPSLRRLQQLVEQSWKQGFDPKGAAHYRNKIVGRKEWIGAVEVSNLMSFMGIDSTVVQFITCTPSRQLLFPFCQAYFSSEEHSLSGSSHRCTSYETTQQILGRIKTTGKMESCRNMRIPLYLQWKGHSVSVVGIAKDKTQLIVLDPARKGAVMSNAIEKNDIKPLLFDPKKLAKKDCQIVVASPHNVSTEQWKIRQTQPQVLTAAQEQVVLATRRGL